jgi:hypothetical protein
LPKRYGMTGLVVFTRTWRSHSKHMQDRLQNVQDLLGLIWKTFEKAAELFQLLAKVLPVRMLFLALCYQ